MCSFSKDGKTYNQSTVKNFIGLEDMIRLAQGFSKHRTEGA